LLRRKHSSQLTVEIGRLGARVPISSIEIIKQESGSERHEGSCFGRDDFGWIGLSTGALHLSRLRGSIGRLRRPFKNITPKLSFGYGARKSAAGGGRSIPSTSAFCGSTPTPTLPRKARERERTAVAGQLDLEVRNFNSERSFAARAGPSACSKPEDAPSARRRPDERHAGGAIRCLIRNAPRRPVWRVLDTNHLPARDHVPAMAKIYRSITMSANSCAVRGPDQEAC
jgi:hypothetical protein